MARIRQNRCQQGIGKSDAEITQTKVTVGKEQRQVLT